MDVLVLLGSFAVLCALAVPVAYSLGLSAIIAAIYVDLPLEAIMLKISDGTDDFALLAIPFFTLMAAVPSSQSPKRFKISFDSVWRISVRSSFVHSKARRSISYN